MLSTTIARLRAADQRDTAKALARVLGARSREPVPLASIAAGFADLGLYDALSALDATDDPAGAFRVGKSLALVLAERALPVFETLRPGDRRAREALEAGRALLQRPEDAEVRRRAAVAAARAYLASTPPSAVWDHAYQAAQAAARIAMRAAEPPRGPDEAALAEAIRVGVPRSEVEAAHPDLKPWYCRSPLGESVGEQAAEAVMRFHDIVSHRPEACAMREREREWEHDLLLGLLGAGDLPAPPSPGQPPTGQPRAAPPFSPRLPRRKPADPPLPKLEVVLARLRRRPGGVYLRRPSDEARLRDLRASVRRELGTDLPPDYERLLGLSDGIQINGVYLYGTERLIEANLECRGSEAFRDYLVVGHSGNVSRFATHLPSGDWQEINFYGAIEAHETHPSFAALLQRIMEQQRIGRRRPAGGPRAT